MNKQWVRVLALVLAVTMIAAACGGDDDDASGSDAGTDAGPESTEPEDEGDPVAGGTLRYGLNSEVDGLNPTTSQLSAAGGLMGRAIFDTLAAYTDDRGWAPKLAESFTPNDDFTEWTMTLRPGVTFHDGELLDAAAVADNFTRMYNDPLVGNAVKPYYDEAEPITVVDDMTVRYNLAGDGSVNWPTSLATQLGMMSSPKWLAAVDAGESDNQSPVGAGPFRFESRSQDSVTRVVRNPDYYGGEAYLDAVEFFPILDGPQRSDQLIQGAIDMLMTTDSLATETLIEAESEGITNILDDTGEESFVMMNSEAPPFDDIRVRQALTFATPRQAYTERIAGGVNRLADQMFVPEQPFYNPDVVQEADDPDRALPLVEEYCAEVPANCTGGKIDIAYQYAGGSVTGERIARLLGEGWSVGGFNVDVQPVPEDQLITNAATGQYQVNTWRQFGAIEPYNDRVWLVCDSVGVISLNWPRFCDERRAELFSEGGASEDEALRIANMQEIVQNMHDAYTYVFLNHTRWDNAYAEPVNGVCDTATAEGVELICTQNGVHFLEHVWVS